MIKKILEKELCRLKDRRSQIEKVRDVMVNPRGTMSEQMMELMNVERERCERELESLRPQIEKVRADIEIAQVPETVITPTETVSTLPLKAAKEEEREPWVLFKVLIELSAAKFVRTVIAMVVFLVKG